MILPTTPAGERPALISDIQSLRPEGSTNAAAGLRLGFDVAQATAFPLGPTPEPTEEPEPGKGETNA